ncbi:MAG: sigma-54-dependent Fis family transcriptional regulator, partial [Deltaproteobacteria bacterium]
AEKRRLGRFELAHQGTIFLDEISEVSPAVQVKLLRVLQERQFERVGGEDVVAVDVRVIAATNKDLEQLVREGRFRQDLLFRLNIVPIVLPPLRLRDGDIEELVPYFLRKLEGRTGKKISEVEADVYRILRAYSWPGNVRELENVVEQAMVFAESEQLRVADLPDNLVRKVQDREGTVERSGGELRIRPYSAPLPELLDRVEKELIQQAFDRAGGVKTECARLLGVKPSALYYKLDKYGIG